MIKPLTSLRFLFALMVFLHHLSFLKLHGEGYNAFYKLFCAEGYIGVNFFFMLSGFILAYVYQDKIIDKSVSPSKFWIYRFARIYPLHLLTLIIALPITYKLFLSGLGTWVLQFASNLFLLHSLIPHSDYYFSFNSVSWSISAEMVFYLLFPFTIPTLAKIAKSKLSSTICLALFVIIVLGLTLLIDRAYYHELFYINPLFRFLDFTIGIILFNFVRKLEISNVKATLFEFASILLLTAFFLLSSFVPKVFRFSVYYWIPTALLIAMFYFQKGFLSRQLLSNRFLVLLGEISFGFYMYHQLVMKYFDKINESFLHIGNPIFIIMIYFIIALSLSFLSYFYFELPLNNIIKKKLIKS